MTATTGRHSHPRINDGPLAPSRRTSPERHEDWSEIEAMLASPSQGDGPTWARTGLRSAVLVRSSLVASVALASLLVAAFWMQIATAPSGPTTSTADAGASPSVTQGRSVGVDRHRP